MRSSLKTSAFGAAIALTLTALAMPASAQSGEQVSIDDLLPELSAAPTAADIFPGRLDLETLGDPDPNTVRLIGDDIDAQYWAARAGSADFCFIVTLKSNPLSASSSCGPVRMFDERGVALEIRDYTGDSPVELEAYLLPADVDASQLSYSATSTRDQATLITSNTGTIPSGATTLERDGRTEPFTFIPLSSGGSNQ